MPQVIESPSGKILHGSPLVGHGWNPVGGAPVSSPPESETISELDATSSELDVGVAVVVVVEFELVALVDEVVSGSVVLVWPWPCGVGGVTGGGVTGGVAVWVGVVVVLVVDDSAGGVWVTGGGVAVAVVDDEESTALVLIPGEVPSLEQLAKVSTPIAPSATPRALRRARLKLELEEAEGYMADTCSLSVVGVQSETLCVDTAEHGSSGGVFQKPAILLHECGFPVSV